MKRTIEWRTPKEYQQPHTIKDELTGEDINCTCECPFCKESGEQEWCIHQEVDQPLKKKVRKSKYCKRLKGPHQYGDWQQDVFNMKPWVGFYTRYCKACNKKDGWTAPNLPGPYWRLDPDARPPVDK